MNVSQIIDAQLLLYLSKLNKLHGEKKVLIFPYGFDECRKVLVMGTQADVNFWSNSDRG